jgi:tryptophan-rich sensory protein
MNYIAALLICVAAAVVEGLCAGRDPVAQLKATKQPAWSPPIAVWVLIGVAWYGFCFTALARLAAIWPDSRVPFILLLVLMLANAGANILQFRLKRLDWAFFFLFPYWLLLAVFIRAAWPLDRLVVALFATYALYQVYAAVWAHALWKLNPPPR